MAVWLAQGEFAAFGPAASSFKVNLDLLKDPRTNKTYFPKGTLVRPKIKKSPETQNQVNPKSAACGSSKVQVPSLRSSIHLERSSHTKPQQKPPKTIENKGCHPKKAGF